MNLIQSKTKKIIFSKSPEFRKRRVNLFKRLTFNLPKPVKIIDIGGTIEFWRRTTLYNNSDYKISIVNLEKQTPDKKIKVYQADGCFLDFIKDNQFDISFSNSTIEHLNSRKKQIKMAQELMRISKNLFLQTPNYYFPIEPHFHLPFFQFLPFKIKVALLKKLKLEGRGKANQEKKIIENIKSINLLTKSEIRSIFPEHKISREKYYGLTKSFIIYSKNLG